MKTEMIISSGEPAGIGPDICLYYAKNRSLESCRHIRALYIGDPLVFRERAFRLGYRDIQQIIVKRDALFLDEEDRPHEMRILPVTFPHPNVCGQYAVDNTPVLFDLLKTCLSIVQEAPHKRAMVTAPIQKSAFFAAGLDFVDHTSWLEASFPGHPTLMLLHSDILRVSLLTTHIPLRLVPEYVTQDKLIQSLRLLYIGLQDSFGYQNPRITVTSLNPHAGDQGLIGSEEQDIIIPAIRSLQAAGMNISGPIPADSLFTVIGETDAFFCLYHDQGLPVFKALSRHSGVNVTLGLPIVRTSVDHGTALSLAGTGKASSASLSAAIDTAHQIIKKRYQNTL